MSKKSKKPKGPKGLNNFGGKGRITNVQTAPMPFSPEWERWMRRREELKFRLGPDCKAQITFEGTITQAAIKRLIDYLQMSLNDFPETEDSTPQGQPTSL